MAAHYLGDLRDPALPLPRSPRAAGGRARSDSVPHWRASRSDSGHDSEGITRAHSTARPRAAPCTPPPASPASPRAYGFGILTLVLFFLFVDRPVHRPADHRAQRGPAAR